MGRRPRARRAPRTPHVARWVLVARVGLVAAWMIAVVTCILIGLDDAEPVVATGGPIAAAGLAAVIAGHWISAPRAVALGGAYLALCAGLFLLVLMLNLNPNSAKLPFLVIGTLFVAVTGWPTWNFLRHPIPLDDALTWACQGCGYLLYGLSEARCPECGRAFDPAALAHLPPPASGMPAPATVSGPAPATAC